jgi:ATP/maltotriose-dependent transcriptional regulator MalT
LSTNLLLVFDRIEFLSSSSLPLLEAMIEEIGEGHQMVVTGYEGTGLPVARYVADGIAWHFSGEDLNFTLDESTELLGAQGFQGDVSQAFETMCGWALGLSMLANGNVKAHQSSEIIQDLINRLPKEVQAWLPELAPLEIWEAQEVIQLGCQVPKNWFEIVSRIGLPATRGKINQLYPHSLLTKILERNLQENDARYRVLHEKSGHFAQKIGQNLKALRHFLSANLIKEALNLAQDLIKFYSNRQEVSLERTMLESFPRESLTNQMLVRLAFCWFNTGKAIEAEELLIELQEGGYSDERLVLTLADFEYRRGNYQKQLEYAKYIHDQKPEKPFLIESLLRQGVALQELGSNYGSKVGF